MDAHLSASVSRLAGCRVVFAHRSLPLLFATIGILLGSAPDARAEATVRTPNFVVTAPNQAMAGKVAKLAEEFRVSLAQEWLGRTLPKWSSPCRVRVKPGTMGASGATTFNISGGHVYDWRMTVEGPYERILDSVLPHEVSHTIFASHFRRPLPRWADEGAATLVEFESERARLRSLLESATKSGRRYTLKRLLTIMEYPQNHRDVLTLYAQGYSLADYLVQQGGKRRYLNFLQTAHEKDWPTAFARHYNIRDLTGFEQKWQGWIMAGSPRLNLPPGTAIASNDAAGSTTTPTREPVRTADATLPPGTVVRGQNNESNSAPPFVPTGRASQPAAIGTVAAPAPIATAPSFDPRDRRRLSQPILRASRSVNSSGTTTEFPGNPAPNNSYSAFPQ